LAFDRETSEWNRLQAGVPDWFPGHLTDSIGSEFDPLKSLIDLVKRILFLREKAEREITIVGVAARIGLVHAKRRSLAALCPRTQVVLGHPGHGIDHRVAQLEELFFLALGE
jgi:hypothetical protein